MKKRKIILENPVEIILNKKSKIADNNILLVGKVRKVKLTLLKKIPLFLILITYSLIALAECGDKEYLVFLSVKKGPEVVYEEPFLVIQPGCQVAKKYTRKIGYVVNEEKVKSGFKTKGSFFEQDYVGTTFNFKLIEKNLSLAVDMNFTLREIISQKDKVSKPVIKESSFNITQKVKIGENNFSIKGFDIYIRLKG